MHIRSMTFCFALILLCGLFCGGIARSQEPAFRIDSYIPRYFTDFQWRLEGFFSADGSRHEILTRYPTEGEEFEQITSFDRQTIDVISDIDYRYETIPRFFNCSVRGAYTLSNRNPHESGGYRYDLAPGIYPTIDAGFYLHSDLLVFLSGTAGWLYSHNLHDVNPDTRRIEYTVDAATGMGWGRIYDGRFAATAMYFVNELKDKGLLNRMPSFVEMDTLTEIVYARRLESYDDNRLHKIASLLSVMNFLETKGIIDPAGPYGYLLIQDVWDYFPNEGRGFGWMVKAGIGLDYFKRLEQTTDQHEESGTLFHTYYHNTRIEQSPYVLARGEYYKSWGIHWQGNMSLEGRYFFDSNNGYRNFKQRYQPVQSTYLQEYKEVFSRFYQISSEIQIAHILDSRTSAGLTMEYAYSHFDSDYRNWHRSKKEGIFSCRATADYRITIPTTLNVSIEYRRQDTNQNRNSESSADEDILHYFYYFTGIRLIHYLF